MTEGYLQILIESLEKKNIVLNDIQNSAVSEILNSEDLNYLLYYSIHAKHPFLCRKYRILVKAIDKIRVLCL